MEAQAIYHIYHLGQVSQVNLYRYYVCGTLGMNINQVQKRKGELVLYVVLHHKGYHFSMENCLDQGIIWTKCIDF